MTVSIVKKKAYLYGRVSTQKQADDGEGLKRQLANAKSFLANKPEYEIDESTIIEDAGVSAYSGANIADSAGLGGFLNAVRQGSIERGSLLVIEAPDRLTRLGLREGQRLFGELADHGIDVGLVRFNLIARHDDLNDFQGGQMISLGLYLGHMESQQKAERIRETLKFRRHDMRIGKIKKMPQPPAWVELDDDQMTYKFTPFAEVVKRMYELRLQGLGMTRITLKLREEGYTSYDGTKITKGKVAYHMRSRKVIGEYQPHTTTKVNGKRVNVPEGDPIPDFYPQLIDTRTFYKVQELLTKSSGGRVATFRNPLRGLSKCPCGLSMTLKSSKKPQGREWSYMSCASHGVKHKMDACDYEPVSFERVINDVVPALRSLDYAKMINGRSIDTRQATEARKEIESLETTLSNDKQALQYLTGAARSAVQSIIHDNEGRLLELKAQVESGAFAMPQEVINEIQENLQNNDLTTAEGRQAFNVNISHFVESITLTKLSWSIVFKGIGVELNFEYSSVNLKEHIKKAYQRRAELAAGTFKDEEELNTKLGSVEAYREHYA